MAVTESTQPLAAEPSTTQMPTVATTVRAPAGGHLQPVAGLRDALSLAVRASDHLGVDTCSDSLPKIGEASLSIAPDRLPQHLGCSLPGWRAQVSPMHTTGMRAADLDTWAGPHPSPAER